MPRPAGRRRRVPRGLDSSRLEVVDGPVRLASAPTAHGGRPCRGRAQNVVVADGFAAAGSRNAMTVSARSLRWLRLCLGMAAFALAGPGVRPLQADVPVRVVRFGDIAPRGAGIANTFEAVGFDPQERVYVALCNPDEKRGRGQLLRLPLEPEDRRPPLLRQFPRRGPPCAAISGPTATGTSPRPW